MTKTAVKGLIGRQAGYSILLKPYDSLILAVRFVPFQVALLHRQSPTAAPLVRSLLTQVLQQDPMNYEAWHGLGLTQKADGSLREAADSFQTAIVLQTTAPAAPFSSLPRALSK